MPAKRDLDPGASPLHFFGAEVRRAREAVGMTLADLGAVVPCDASTMSKIEAGQLRPGERDTLWLYRVDPDPREVPGVLQSDHVHCGLGRQVGNPLYAADGDPAVVICAIDPRSLLTLTMTGAADRSGSSGGRNARVTRLGCFVARVEVVAFLQVLDEPGLRRLPARQLAGQRARRRDVEREELG